MAALEYSTTDDITGEAFIKMLIYGRSGVGKTLLAATAPAPMILSAEGGLLSLSKKNQIKVFGTYKNIEVVKIKTLADLDRAYELASNNQLGGAKTLFVDTITEIAEVLLTHAKQTVSDPRQAYGEMLDKIIITLKAFRDLPNYHVIFIAKEESMGSDSETLYGPMMPGKKAGPQLPYLFDEVLRLGIGKLADGSQFHFLQTQPDLQFAAKDRSGSLEAMEKPDLTHIINKILSHG